MKVNELIIELQKLDQDKKIFIRNFMMCDTFEINNIKISDINQWNKGIDNNNIGDYYISENDNWLENNS